MTFESLLHPYTLIFIVGFIIGIMGPHCGGRRKMMACKFSYDTLSSVYLFLIGGHAGAYGALIAGSGALIQALTPHHYLKATIWLRIGFALVLSIISIFVSYEKPTDLLPILMVIVCRFGELQSNSNHIRMVYFTTSIPWIIYYAVNGYYLPMGATILMGGSLLISIIRHHIALKTVLVMESP